MGTRELEEKDLVAPAADRNARAILGFVSERLGVSRAQILGTGKGKTVAFARHVAMYLAKKVAVPEPSYPELGRLFDRNHTTVLAAIRKVDGLRKCGAREASIVSDLEARLA